MEQDKKGLNRAATVSKLCLGIPPAGVLKDLQVVPSLKSSLRLFVTPPAFAIRRLVVAALLSADYRAWCCMM